MSEVQRMIDALDDAAELHRKHTVKLLDRHNAEIARLTKANAELREALDMIASGSFAGASTFAINGDWHSMTTDMQTIARAALANSSEGE